jgi:nitroreductase
MEGNRAWAQHAPVLMLSVAKLQFDRDGQPNRHALHDVGLATANLVTQATSLGLFAHQMAGFDAKKARELFAIPEAWEPVAVIALGYSDGVDTPPAPRSRKPLEDFVFAGRWGQPAPLVTPALEEA